MKRTGENTHVFGKRVRKPRPAHPTETTLRDIQELIAGERELECGYAEKMERDEVERHAWRQEVHA